MFNRKSDEFGWVSKAKSRLVARGFKQREGIDFGETFAPTVSGSCVRLLSAIACELDLDVCHFDVEQAFVQSKLDEDVFLRLPRGCGRLSGKVVRLNKSLYGLKQASRSWHAHLTTCLNTLGFQQCLADACVFRLVEEGRIAIIAVVHVDDIFAVGLKSRCDLFRDELNRMVPVKNLGELRWYGGCHYAREREMGTLTISQKTFADELVKKYGVTSTQSVPLRVGIKLEEFNEDEMVENWPFRELVGSLMWYQYRRVQISPMQCELLRDTVQRRKPSTGRQPLASWSTLMGLVSTVLRFREGLCLAFHWKYSQMLTTLRRQLTGDQYQAE